jgi:hypothetical protein
MQDMDFMISCRHGTGRIHDMAAHTRLERFRDKAYFQRAGDSLRTRWNNGIMSVAKWLNTGSRPSKHHNHTPCVQIWDNGPFIRGAFSKSTPAEKLYL